MSANDFDFLLGSWDIRHRRLRNRLADDPSCDEFTGYSQIRKSFGGLGNFDESVLHLPGGTYVGVTIRLYDPKSELWSISWVDSRNPAFDVPMVGRFEGGIGRFFCDESFNGRPIRVRFLWSQIAATSARWEQAFSTDGGDSWETNWVMDFTRTAEASQPSSVYETLAVEGVAA
ncbi:DUF1579 domain-containing protein [Lacibacterium aquatile]|uniref:DUF1579 domain-containing protein n=1 Tax=Lacibacterium aquatile TaxID=1168082 RepID=A0ABW5DYU2_9PROT